VIRLHASPAPLQQKPVRGAHLTVVTDDTSTVPTSGEGDIPSDEAPLAPRFLATLAGAVGSTTARLWLKDVTLEQVAGEWVLLAGTRFAADWIRQHFDLAVREAAKGVGLMTVPPIRARTPPALPP
jgi:hypothetical protein